MIKRLCFAFVVGALSIQAIYADKFQYHSWDFVGAAGDGDLATVKSLVDRGVLYYESKENKLFFVSEALGEATTNGHLAVVKYLVENLGANVNSKFSKNPKKGNPILLEAADKGHLAIVQYLVSKGANVNLAGRCGYPALYDSANDTIWDYLKPKTKGLNTSLAFINAARRGNLGQVKSFLEQLKQEGKNMNDIKVNANDYFCETSALVEASYYGHLAVVKFLVENGANVNSFVKSSSDSNKTIALISASFNGHLEVVQFLVENGADINYSRNRALEIAAEQGHLAVVRYLVSRGADVKMIMLSSVAKNGHLEVVKYLVSQGADIRGALHGAISRGDLEFVKYILSQGIDITKDSGYIKTHKLGDYSPIKTQAEKNQYLANIVEITRLLIANGAKVGESDLIGAVKPAQYERDRYIYSHFFEVVKMLVNNGANVNYQNRRGETALMFAVINPYHTDITQYLLQHGANVNLIDNDGETALDKALGSAQATLLKRYGAKHNKYRESSNTPKAPPNVHIKNHKSDSPRNTRKFPPNVNIRIID